MRDTRFDARSSEWIGDMSVWLRDHAEDNSEQLERLRRGLRRAREQELTPRQNEDVSKILHTISDFERISDHAVNIAEAAQEIDEKHLNFSDAASTELSTMRAT